jgi:hypothetical protein
MGDLAVGGEASSRPLTSPSPKEYDVSRTLLTSSLTLAALALAGPAASAQAPPTTDLTKASLRGHTLTIDATCERDGMISAQPGGDAQAKCHNGRTRVRLRLPSRVARRAVTGRGFRLPVRIDVDSSPSTERVSLARPQISSRPTGRAATWSSASSMCAYYGTTRWHEVKANNDTFGQPYSRIIWIRAVLQVYNPSTATSSYVYGTWAKHEAGFSAGYIDGRLTNSPVWSRTISNARRYSRSYIEVYGGSSDWVRVSTAPSFVSPNWCYWAS